MSELPPLDPRNQRLLDREEIHEGIYRFARGVDRHEWGRVRSCYHPGARDNHSPFNGDAQEYSDWVS